jgi:hypothetical protein
MVLVILKGDDEKPDKFLDKTLWRNEENVQDED